jgi:serine kinase of HPr protein (carbohydrate metabolism regulator)
MSGITLHASCVLVGETGILIRGESGSGKSRLVGELLIGARQLGWFARLVADDRVRVETWHGRLVARAVAPLAGALEVRGLGIVQLAHEPAAIVRLLIEASPEKLARLPQASERETAIEGVRLPCLVAPAGAGPVHRVLGRLCGLHDTVLTS